MPLFEYECRTCGRHFEYLTRDSQSPSCPSCDGDNLQRLLSVFAVGTNGGTLSPRETVGACGTCGDPRGPGSCRVN